MLQARKEDGTPAGGSWEKVSQHYKTITCKTDGDTITHASNQYRSYHEVYQWKSPADLEGKVKFTASLVLSKSYFYVGIESPMIVNSKDYVPPTTKPTTTTTPSTTTPTTTTPTTTTPPPPTTTTTTTTEPTTTTTVPSTTTPSTRPPTTTTPSTTTDSVIAKPTTTFGPGVPWWWKYTKAPEGATTKPTPSRTTTASTTSRSTDASTTTTMKTTTEKQTTTERVPMKRSYKVSVTLSMEVVYNANYSSKNSSFYRTLESKVCQDIAGALKQRSKESRVCRMNYFLPSQAANFDLEFSEKGDPKTPGEVFKELTDEIVEYIESGNSSTTSKLISVLDADECKHSEDNDCSKYAKCVNVDTSYTCECLPGYVDKRRRRGLPGRACAEPCKGSYPCLNGAQCESRKDGPVVCVCAEGFSGEKCEIKSGLSQAEIVVIIVFVIIIIVGVPMSVVCFCLWKERKRRKLMALKKTEDEKFDDYYPPSYAETYLRLASTFPKMIPEQNGGTFPRESKSNRNSSADSFAYTLPRPQLKQKEDGV